MSEDENGLPAVFREAITRSVTPPERVLYAGRPDWRAELGTLVVLFLAGLCCSAIAFPCTAVSFAGLAGIFPVTSGGAVAGPGKLLLIFLLSIPFSVIGAVGIAAPLLSVRKSLNTVHVVTERRLLNIYIGRDKGEESFPLGILNFVTRTNRRDGTGTLEIAQGVELDGDGSARPAMLNWPGIPDAARAEAAIREHAAWVR